MSLTPTIPRITKAQAAEHFAKNVAGQYPPRAKALLDNIWGGKQPAAEPAEEVVIPPGVFEFTVPEDGYYSVSYTAPPFEGPQNRQGRRAHARKMRKLGLGQVEIRRVSTEGGAA